MNRYIITFGVCLILVVSLTSASRCQIKECKLEFSIDYVGWWSDPYDACHPEMKTTFNYHVVQIGGYGIIWAQVDNTPFSEYYDASELCPEPPCYGSDVKWTHCDDLEEHALIMDVITTSETYGFDEYELIAQYFANKPD